MPERDSFDDTHPHLSEFRAFLGELNKESDRGVALISAAMLDDLLGKSIAAFLVDHPDTKELLEGFNAPLGTLSARILGAFALGIISQPVYEDCQLIRRVRNTFAHDVQVSFNTQRVKDFCSRLALSAEDYGDVILDARAKYTTAATGIILNLTNRPHYVATKRLAYGNWRI